MKIRITTSVLIATLCMSCGEGQFFGSDDEGSSEYSDGKWSDVMATEVGSHHYEPISETGSDVSACHLEEFQRDKEGFIDFEKISQNNSGFGLRGGVVGNGGDALVWLDEEDFITRIELLDYFEGREIFEMELSLGGEELEPLEKVELAFDRLRVLDPERAARYDTHKATFMDEVRWIKPGLVLPDIPDSHHFILPEGAEIKQFAIQREPKFPGDKRYNISQEFYENEFLTNNHRAGLILHEIIYREAVELGHTDSVKARNFNVMVSSDRLTSMSERDYQDMMLGLDLPPVISLNGVKFYVGSIEYTEEGEIIIRGKLFGDHSPKDGLSFASGSYLSFHDEETFKEGTLASQYKDYDTCIKVPAGLSVTFDVYGKLAMIDGRSLRDLLADDE